MSVDQKWLDQIPDLSDVLYIFYGLGDGKHLLALLQKVYPQDKIIVVESDDEKVRRVAKTVPELGNYRKLYIVSSWEGFKGLYLQIGDWVHLIHVTNPSVHRSRREREAVEKFRKTVDREANTLLTDTNTTNYFSPRWQKNLLRNVREQLPSSGISLQTKYHGPAVVVAAGPSLEESLPVLREYQDRALILATQTTNRRVQAGDLHADVIFSFDGGQPNYFEHFDDVELDVPLVYDPTVYWKATRTWQGPKSLMLVHEANSWIEDYSEQKIGQVHCGPSIANTMCHWAHSIGASPILLVGQDMAYTGGRYHAPGTHKSGVWEDQIPPDKTLVELPGLDGKPVQSDTSMQSFLHWFQELKNIHCPDIALLNCTAAGAKIDGVSQMDLEQAFKGLKPRRGSIDHFVECITRVPDWNLTKLETYFEQCAEEYHALIPYLFRASAICDGILHGNGTEIILKYSRDLSEVHRAVQARHEYLKLLHYRFRSLTTSLRSPLQQSSEMEYLAQVSKKLYQGILDCIYDVLEEMES